MNYSAFQPILALDIMNFISWQNYWGGGGGEGAKRYVPPPPLPIVSLGGGALPGSYPGSS